MQGGGTSIGLVNAFPTGGFDRFDRSFDPNLGAWSRFSIAVVIA